jgi:hypothetical protein
MLGFADKAEKNFTAADALAAAQAKITALEAEVAALKAASTDFEAKIITLTGEAESHKQTAAAKESELKNVQAQLVAAQGKANAVIAAQGLPIDQIPTAGTEGGTTTAKENAWEKYARLMAEGKSREAGEFWQAHADEILASRHAATTKK